MSAESWLFVCSILIRDWDVKEWGHFGELLDGVAAALTFLAVVIAGIVGLRRYTRQLRLRAADLLLKMEPEHRKVLDTCLEIELWSTHPDVARILTEAKERGNVKEPDRKKLGEIDRCLRFFYACTVLDHLGVDEIAIVRAYYFYFLLLLESGRPELHSYLAKYYPRLSYWLERNKSFLEYFKVTGEWKPSWWRFRQINKARMRDKQTALDQPKYEK